MKLDRLEFAYKRKEDKRWQIRKHVWPSTVTG